MMAVMVGAALAFGGVGAVAVGNGDCLQDRDQLQLKDGSCQLAATDSGDLLMIKNQTQLQLKDGSCLITEDTQDKLYSYDYGWYYNYGGCEDGCDGPSTYAWTFAYNWDWSSGTL